MKKILAGLALAAALTLAGCAGELQKLQTVWTVVNGATVSPKAILVAANSFDALERTAAKYLDYCRPRLSEPICSAGNRRVVIRAVREGRGARDQLEVYISGQTPGPARLYNILIGALNTLTASPATAAGSP